MDPLADMITSIKNAGNAGKDELLVPYSKVKESVVKVLEKEGYVKSVSKIAKGGRNYLAIGLIMENRVPRIRDVKRISKPSKRVYKKYSEIRPVKNGYGLLVISTPEGVMTGRDARKAGVGGEVLFTIW